MRRRIISGLFLFVLLAGIAFFCTSGHAEAAGEQYVIGVNCAANTVTVLCDGVPVRVMICSTGEDTPQGGTFASMEKSRWWFLYGDVYGQYSFRITGHILFHSVPYTVYEDPGTLEPGEFDKLGTAASQGCVRMMVGDVKWIFEHCPSGTPVVFYRDAACPSPMGTPFFAGIGRFPAPFNSWDPTDLTAGNPWLQLYGACFDAQWYLAANPDLQGKYAWTEESLRLHWVTTGIAEGRYASEPMYRFLQQHPDYDAMYKRDPYSVVIALNRLAGR